MLSSQTPFLDLLKQENLSRISIDRDLIPVFANVMKKWQIHFEKKGYLYANDYAALLEKVLLEDSTDKYSIIYEQVLEGTSGLFYHDEKKIAISPELKNGLSTRKEEVLSHELLHLITLLYYYENGKTAPAFARSPVVYKSGFVKEGLTEGLNQKIYPNSFSYSPQVKMMDFFNYVTETPENYYAFLSGSIYLDNKHLIEFCDKADAYHNSITENYRFQEAVENKLYNEAQSGLIRSFKEKIERKIYNHEFMDVNDYAEAVYNFEVLAPIKTEELYKNIKYLHQQFVDNYYDDVKLTDAEFNKYVSKVDDLCIAKYKIDREYISTFTLKNDLFETEIDIFENEIEIPKQGVIIKKGQPYNGYRNITYTNPQTGKQALFTMFFRYNGQDLEIEFSYPINTISKISAEDMKANNEDGFVKKQIQHILGEFEVLSEKNNMMKNMYHEFNHARVVKEVAFAQLQEKFYVQETYNGAVKIWYPTNQAVVSMQVEDIDRKLNTVKTNKPKKSTLIPTFGSSYKGHSIKTKEGKELFIHLDKDKEFTVALVDETDKIILPDYQNNLKKTIPQKKYTQTTREF